MNVTLKIMLEKLGVNYMLGPYETCPWNHYEPDDEKTCSAEVRMNPDGDEIEAEIQILTDDPEGGIPVMEPIYFIRAKPGNGGKWNLKHFLLKGEPFDTSVSRWQEKACSFFHAVVQELMMEKFPDIETLIKEELLKKERGADQYGGGGGKSPKVKGQQLMGIKKGGSF